MTEIPLAGGNVTTVVRVGDTVRRTPGPWTPAVHALLRHLAVAGFDAVPRPLGYDESGREVLSYVEGQCGEHHLPPEWTSEDGMCAAAALLRRFHDAQVGFTAPPDARWQQLPGQPVNADPSWVICHVDNAPYNTVLRPDGTFALIDFDFAAPGPRLWDVAYAAWRWVPLYRDTDAEEHGWPAPVDRVGRLRRFVDVYGLADEQRAALVSMIRRRISCMIETIRERAERGEPAWVRMWNEGHAAGPRRDLALLDSEGGDWERALR